MYMQTTTYAKEPRQEMWEESVLAALEGISGNLNPNVKTSEYSIANTAVIAVALADQVVAEWTKRFAEEDNQ